MKVEVIRQKGRWHNHISLIAFTEGENKGEILGTVNHDTKVIELVDTRFKPLTPENLVLLGEAFKTFKF